MNCVSRLRRWCGNDIQPLFNKPPDLQCDPACGLSLDLQTQAAKPMLSRVSGVPSRLLRSMALQPSVAARSHNGGSDSVRSAPESMARHSSARVSRQQGLSGGVGPPLGTLARTVERCRVPALTRARSGACTAAAGRRPACSSPCSGSPSAPGTAVSRSNGRSRLRDVIFTMSSGEQARFKNRKKRSSIA